MKHLLATVCAAWLAFAAPGHAQSDDAVVVELFTSQGCSSCPPADAIFGALAADNQVIALSLHVDYWDYLGWKDKFADPQFTARQKAYAHFARDKMIYTPQIVVQGQARVVGNRPDEVAAAIGAHSGQPQRAHLRLQRSGAQLLIRAAPVPGVEAPLRVQLVHFDPSESVLIERGENAGKTITYSNIVTSWQLLGKWDGQTALDLAIPAGSGPLAVILQADGPGEIFGAAVLK
ncbi:thioredoxin family protein [Pseudorhodobacter sp.]|uniref:DUF1223 domain-containing protein n=1 Tax=Pseudorhodobacter sp. TaxID=1934400 RepID=UPI002648254B|nr:DUF1223 domain-containing protein [Pseudorhodobacter sp.]MDN5787658.1 DUF1223 domain-containing protein [Pseudorhodobacter sp.]